jgi:predicted small integral membrane protein
VNAVGFAKAALLGGLALWLSIAALNNATDQGTNRSLIGAMLDMRLIDGDNSELGHGLLWRSVNSALAVWLLWFVIIYQAAVSIYLWKAAFAFAHVTVFPGSGDLERARATGVRALTLLMMLWLFFLCGGLWFGYWLKQGSVQLVHLMLLIVSIVSIVFIACREIETPS